MDPSTLQAAMGGTLPPARYAQLCPAFNAALAQAGCATVNRAAMFCAQIAHESAGLKYMQEIASGQAYEGRRDLGNTQPGDGRRFKGHGPIQITGRANHTAVSKWAHAHGYVPTPTYFVDHPEQLGDDRYGFLGPVWYWTVARPKINAMCDARDVEGVTRAINGGVNGLVDRRRKYETCLRLGNALLPTGAPTPQEDDLPSVPEVWAHPIDDVFTAKPGDSLPAFAALAWATANAGYARGAAERCERKLDEILAELRAR